MAGTMLPARTLASTVIPDITVCYGLYHAICPSSCPAELELLSCCCIAADAGAAVL